MGCLEGLPGKNTSLGLQQTTELFDQCASDSREQGGDVWI